MAAMNANAKQKLAIRRSDEEVLLLVRVGVLSRGICQWLCIVLYRQLL